MLATSNAARATTTPATPELTPAPMAVASAVSPFIDEPTSPLLDCTRSPTRSKAPTIPVALVAMLVFAAFTSRPLAISFLFASSTSRLAATCSAEPLTAAAAIEAYSARSARRDSPSLVRAAMLARAVSATVAEYPLAPTAAVSHPAWTVRPDSTAAALKVRVSAVATRRPAE